MFQVYPLKKSQVTGQGIVGNLPSLRFFGEPSARSFFKRLKLNMSLDQYSEVLKSNAYKTYIHTELLATCFSFK